LFIREIAAPVTDLKGAGPNVAARLARLGVFSGADLLLLAPRDYEDRSAKRLLSEFGSGAVVRDGGAPRLDLVAANIGIADRLGLGSVSVVEGCTCCDGRFGSYRRQGAARFTRMAAVIGYGTAL